MVRRTRVASVETQHKKRPVPMSHLGNTSRDPEEMPASKIAKNPAHPGPPSKKGKNWKAWRAGPRSVAPGDTMAQEKRAESESIIAVPRPPVSVSHEDELRLLDDESVSLRRGVRAARQSAEAS
jgi:hypothetical protein